MSNHWITGPILAVVVTEGCVRRGNPLPEKRQIGQFLAPGVKNIESDLTALSREKITRVSQYYSWCGDAFCGAVYRHPTNKGRSVAAADSSIENAVKTAAQRLKATGAIKEALEASRPFPCHGWCLQCRRPEP
jgi:hypothetical protein